MTSPHPRPLVLVDFDHTLFKTGTRFWPSLAAALAAASGEPLEKVSDLREPFTQGEGTHRHLRYEDLLDSLGITSDEVAQELQGKVDWVSLMHPDAFDFLTELRRQEHWDYGILTFGETQFQQMKLDLVPVLHDLPAYITLQAKGTYIQEQFPGRTGALVDDRDQDDLPERWTQVFVDRQGRKSPVPIARQVTDLRVAIPAIAAAFEVSR